MAIYLVHLSRNRHCEADPSSAEAISIEEVANKIASSCLSEKSELALAKTILLGDRPPELDSGSYQNRC